MLPTLSFSQNTYPKIVNDSLIVITPKQLKQTNFIFLEHKKLKLQIPELNSQIESLEKYIDTYMLSDSIKENKIQNLEAYAKSANNTIIEQSSIIKDLEVKKNLFRQLSIGGFTVSLAMLSILILK